MCEWTHVSHKASGQYRAIPIPNGKKVIAARTWDRAVIFEWNFYNQNLYYTLFTIYNGGFVYMSSEVTMDVYYILVDA